jgi:hypothetical protein
LLKSYDQNTKKNVRTFEYLRYLKIYNYYS